MVLFPKDENSSPPSANSPQSFLKKTNSRSPLSSAFEKRSREVPTRRRLGRPASAFCRWLWLSWGTNFTNISRADGPPRLWAAPIWAVLGRRRGGGVEPLSLLKRHRFLLVKDHLLDKNNWIKYNLYNPSTCSLPHSYTKRWCLAVNIQCWPWRQTKPVGW